MANEMIQGQNQDLIPGVPAYTPTALLLHPETPFEDWVSIGNTLKQMEKSVMWWIGDWCNFGERKYGEKYSQALETTGYAYQTVADAAWVAARIEVSRRKESLSFSHHREAASLATQDEADEILQKAETEGLSKRELRAEVRILKGTAPPPPYEGEVKSMFNGLWIPVPSGEFEVGQKVKITKIKGGV